MSLPTDLLAFFEEHRWCGDLDGGVQGGRVLMSCDCGAVLARPITDEPPTPWNPRGPKGGRR